MSTSRSGGGVASAPVGENGTEGADSGYVFGRRYAWYALALLLLVGAFNLIDRMIVTILAGEIKADFGLSNAEFGLVYGTFFAVFYALFGIPLARLADTWLRARLLAIGLAGWSLMTLLGGLAANMSQFSLTRIGVGLGEATSGPAATSLLSDYFPRRLRGTALGLYSCGVPIGLGISLVLGGAISQTWNEWFQGGQAPLDLQGWQAAFIAVALPGFLLAALVASLREPPRGISDGLADARVAHPFRRAWQEFMAVLPPFAYYSLARVRIPARAWLQNFLLLAVMALGTLLLSGFLNGRVPLRPDQVYLEWGRLPLTVHTLQWGVFSFGLYSVFCWAQVLGRRDPVASALTFGTPTVVSLVAAAALFMCIVNGLMAWAPHFAIVRYQESPATVGLRFGAVAAIAGLAGTALGGWLGDRLRNRTPSGRLYVSLAAMTLPAPLAWLTISQDSFEGFLFAFVLLSVVTTAWYAGILSTLQDLVLPRMRGMVYAIMYLGMTVVGLGSGPYLAGFISDMTGDLGTGILCLYLLTPLIALAMLYAIRHADKAESTKIGRAVAAGEILSGGGSPDAT